ncbi:hypothetical protein U1Q18_042406 [Sarracenia purpurea var. burkii]
MNGSGGWHSNGRRVVNESGGEFEIELEVDKDAAKNEDGLTEVGVGDSVIMEFNKNDASEGKKKHKG